MTETKINNQMAFEYALYIIASSYFHKVSSKHSLLEDKLILRYKDQKVDTQYRMEEICIRYMDRLKRALPAALFEKDASILFKRQNGRTRLLFVAGPYILELSGEYAGAGSQIACNLWTRKVWP